MASVPPLPQVTPYRNDSDANFLADHCPCETCRTSAPDLNGPRVLATVTPRLDESLIGLIARVSARNWQRRLRTVLSATTATWHAHYNLAARDDIDFGQLAFACRLAPHEVEDRRYRRHDLSPKLPGLNFHGATVPIYDLDLRSRRTCQSWVRAGYHSAFGHHGLVTHCTDSGEILLDACPHCGAKFTWSRSSLHFCHWCGLDTTDRPAKVVPPCLRESTALLLDVVHPHPERHSRAVENLHPMLAGVNRGTLFELGWRLGCALSGHGQGCRDKAFKLPVETRLKILDEGSKALAAWPESVTNSLAGLRAGADRASLAIANDVLLIATSQNSWPELRMSLREVTPGLRLSRQAAVKAGLAQGANSGELQKVLGVGQRVVDRLRGSEQLEVVRSSGTIKSLQIFEAADLGQLARVFQNRISIGAIAERLDISHHGVEQLACLGHVHIYDHGAVRVGFARRQAKKSDFVRLLQALNEAATKHDATGRECAQRSTSAGTVRTIGIHAAMRAIGGREKPWGPAILAMLSGELPFELDRSNDVKFMSRVSIARADLHKLVNMRFDETNFLQFCFEPSINGRDAEELLNIYPKVMQAAKREQVIPAPVTGAYDRQNIRNLAGEYISSAEIIARCSGGTKKLPPPFKGREPPIQASALGWFRETAEVAVAAYDTCNALAK